MNRAFKTEFHGNNPDRKNIVTMSVVVNNGKLFKNLSSDEILDLTDCLIHFKEQINRFISEIINMPANNDNDTQTMA